MRFRSRTGGRRELKESLRKSQKRAADLEAALTALMPGEGEQVPPELLAAASMAGPDGQAVRTTIDGREIIVVIGDEGGSEAAWVAAIRDGLARRIAS